MLESKSVDDVFVTRFSAGRSLREFIYCLSKVTTQGHSMSQDVHVSCSALGASG